MFVGAEPKVLLNEISQVRASPVSPDVLAFHTALPGYAKTPLFRAPKLAKRLGVSEVLVKNESLRLGLPAFKMLGASWAAYRSVLHHTGIKAAEVTTVEDLATALKPHLPLRLVTATDGNHGRAVARIAQLFGLSATIWVPMGTARSRIEAIESEGAICVTVDGTYDDAVKIAARAADDETLVISDTSWPGYEDVPMWVVEGYSTMMREIDDQVEEEAWPRPTTIAIPLGVGSLAAAAINHYGHSFPRPVIVGAEPTRAACVMAALASDGIVNVPGPHTTEMVGMACGTASALAMPSIRSGMRIVASFEDEWAFEAMRLLADEGVVTGATGAASLGVLLSLANRRPDLAAIAHLEDDDVALVIVTEGATDPVNYAEVVGSQ